MPNDKSPPEPETAAQQETGGGCQQEPCSESSGVDADPYQSEDYQRFMAEVAKTCDAADSPCDSCLAGAPCDGPPRHELGWPYDDPSVPYDDDL